MEPSWSLHLLSEVLSAFSTDDPDNLWDVLNRVAESVDAEVCAVTNAGRMECCIGLAEDERLRVLELASSRPSTIRISGGTLCSCWAALGGERQLLIGRVEIPFELEERSLLRAMARSIELSLRMLEAITAERQARQDASHQARHDPLTGLPNRVLVLETLNRWLQRRPGLMDKPIAVLFIDVDRFKWVNDAHGHAAGDELLVHVSRILQAAVRRDDLVGRLSGDEFIVITRTSSRDGARDLAQRIVKAVRKPLRLAGAELSHSASMGICFAGPSDTASTLIENADMAMYQAKAQGRGRYAVFEPMLREQARERLDLEEALRHAVDQEQIETHLQPVVQIRTGQLVGFEALVRWNHPRRGLLSPQHFIGAAEESGLIEEIDLAVFSTATAAVARWQRLPGWGNLRISSNISARTLASAGLVQRLQSRLQGSGVNTAQVYLEITETSLVDDIQATGDTIRGLQDLGLKLAIDDFGTGYSSLLYLKRFPVGLLKIDQSFVADLGHDPDDETIAKAIVSLARSLGVQAVAEGVETADQEKRLRKMGCEYGQGYRYGRPLPIATVERQWFGAAQAIQTRS